MISLLLSSRETYPRDADASGDSILPTTLVLTASAQYEADAAAHNSAYRANFV